MVGGVGLKVVLERGIFFIVMYSSKVSHVVFVSYICVGQRRAT